MCNISVKDVYIGLKKYMPRNTHVHKQISLDAKYFNTD